MSTSPNNHDEDVWVENNDGYFETNVRQLRQMEFSINLTAGFETENGVHHVYRNEKHNNGGQFAFTMPSEFEYTKFHAKLKLFHEGTESVAVPMPAVSKEHRLRTSVNGGIILNSQELQGNTIALTKYQTKYKVQLGIRPGSDFNTYTKAKFPEFVLQVIPMMGDKYLMDDAIRSPSFVLKSKRQQRFLPESKRASNCKRRREIGITNGLHTTAKNADDTIARLRNELKRSQADIAIVKNHFEDIQNQLSGQPSTALSIGLLFGSDLAVFAPCE
jgi:hypothetical protein